MCSLRHKPDQLFYYFFIATIAANGIVISIGRAWTLPQLMAMAMLFFWVLKLAIGASKTKYKILPFPFFLLSLWLLVIVFSIVFSPPEPYSPYSEDFLQSYKVIGVMFFFWIVLDIAIMWYVYNTIKEGEVFIKTFKILIYSSVIYSIYGIYQYVMASLFGVSSSPVVYALNYHYIYDDYIIRLLSLSREPLYFVNYIGPILIICIALIVTKSHKILEFSKKSLLIIIGINFLAFFLAKSTGGFIAVLGGILVMFVSHYRENLNRFSFKGFAYTLLGILVFIAGFYQLFGREVERRIVRLIDPASGYGRIVSIVEALESFTVYPYFGFGLGHSKFFISITQIHNAYLNILAETGIFSLFIFLSFLTFLAYQLKKAYRSAGIYKGLVLGITGAFVYVLIQWLSFFAYIVIFAWFLFGIILALPQSINSLKNEKISNIKIQK